MKTGVDLIAEERLRQLGQEGWSFAHDDAHDAGQMAMAAACYAMPYELRSTSVEMTGSHRDGRRGKKIPDLFSMLWPWARTWWKPTPTDRIRELVKAGALIAAEIDREQRWRALSLDRSKQQADAINRDHEGHR